ncbi:MAG: hypothetical protein EBW87_02070 [Burkholderiaceae bacterium]|nr:hypothetical protein [Burkholderiaceae bacterium]
MTKREKLEGLYRTWRELVKTKEKMGATMLELLSHPEGSIEHIAEAAPRYKDIVARLRAHKPKIIEALAPLPLLQRAVIETKL